MKKETVTLCLAPMEGVVDWVFRDLLTQIGGIDRCVTEFIRVTDRLHPEHMFLDYCPELKTGSRTRSGVPVQVQLLGGRSGPLAENAARAAALGAWGIDLNFGCPAKTVNRHDGGATLLKSPDRIFEIVSAVRAAVPKPIPVSAKIRLGFDDPAICLKNAEACDSAGADWITVHCRTKADMYRPPAYWDWIPKIKEKFSRKVIANGEIWNADDFSRCQQVTGCGEFMIGRGAIANPFIFQEIKTGLTVEPWQSIRGHLLNFFDMSAQAESAEYGVSRTKQWLAQVSKRHPAALPVFDAVKRIHHSADFRKELQGLIT